MSKQRTHGGIRRLVSGLLCLALMLGLLPSGIILPAQAHWADPYGQKLVEWGVMRGDISGNLNLAKPITRAELVTMINRAYGYTRKAGVPFTDVPSSKWYADDIDIAYNAGYFKGVSSNRAAPESNVTREQAAVFLARNLMLQETVGETLGFSDTRTLSEWSRGLIGAAVKDGVLNGYADGSFKPQSNITRGELAAMLVRAIGTPVDKAGDHALGHVYGNVTLNTSNVNLRNTTIYGNLYLTGGIDLGHVLLENVTVLGRIVISGAGEAIEGQESIVLRNVEAEEMVVDSLRTHTVTIRVQGVTDIPLTTVRANSFINDASWDGYGLARIELRGEPGRKFQLAGSIKEVVNYTPASDLQFVKGSAEKVTVDEEAIASNVLVDKNTRLDQLNLDVGTTVTGQGDIKNLNVASSGSVVEQLPDQIVIRPGIDADIDGTVMGNSDAAELSAEPRLNAGYPYMKNVSPNQADGVFSGSKPGTIYWAISAVADGSVSEEDLIENPAYGGNIFQEQAGAINTTSANTEYISKVEQLEPDGSYYVSAILVDGRGKRSPLKVAAFTTPDDTKPAFVKDPTLTKNTTDTTQATVMANKSCLLYWALLPTGAQAPTPQEFKTGSLGGNYGYGSLSLMKNAEISVTVNRQKLREKTTYDLFLWLTDHNGAQSMDAPFKITFTTPDETPPVVTAPTQVPPYGADFANVQFSMNEAPATLFWAVVPEGDTTFIVPGDTPEETAEIMSDLRTKIKVEGAGDSVTSSGNTPVATAYANIAFQISKLDTAKTGTNSYTMYYVGKDAAGNYSDRVQSIVIKTLDTTPPEVEQQFTEAVEGRPRASSSIKLVFSETVKGGAKEGGKTFLDFYQDVLDATDDPTRKTARDNLAAELAAHIKMYYVPRSGQPQLLEPKGDGQTDTNWVIDFHNAQVTLENGKMIITLPNNEPPDDSALQLDSGATYYFQLLGVYDNAFQPNGLADDPNGNYKLDNFTTIYGQVELAPNTTIPSITVGGKTVRLDMCVDVKPESTEKMPDTEYWDMVIWSDVGINVQIYLQEGDGATWKLLNQDREIDINGGFGLSTKGEVGSNHPLRVVKDSLKEGVIYRYGIHITQVGNIKESDPSAEPQDWSELVTMKFSIVAGTIVDVRNLSLNVNQNYDKLVNEEKKVTEIGIEYLQTGTRRILEFPKQFTDTRVPNFTGGTPKFDPGSGTIDMKVSVDRPGKVWWVAAPAGIITTALPGGTEITSANDGTDATKVDQFTYVPTGGQDRDKNKSNIYYETGNNGKPGEYLYPTYRDIINGKETYKKNPGIKTGVMDVSTWEETIPITGLEPETWYYVYIVRQGGGDPNRIVEIYRVETEEVKVPAIDVQQNGSSGATIRPDQDSELAIALVELGKLPESIFGNYFNSDNSVNTDSVIYKMITPANGSNGKSKFDDDGTEEEKSKVANYVLGTDYGGTSALPTAAWKLYEGATNNGNSYNGTTLAYTTIPWDVANEMKAAGSEYVLLVVGRHPFGGTLDPGGNRLFDGNDYGFGAIRSLFQDDMDNPEFTGKDKPAIRADVEAQNVPPTENWWDHPEKYAYSGTVDITFSKPLYWRDDKTQLRQELTYDLLKGDNNIISGGGFGTTIKVPDGKKGAVGSTITLKIDNLRTGSITLPANGHFVNASGYEMPYRIRLTFDRTLTLKDYGNGSFTETAAPGFRVEIVPG